MGNRARLSVTQEDRFIRVVLPDAIGMDDSHQIEKEIVTHLSEGNNQLVIDLSKTTALYSSGIGLLIRLQKISKENENMVYLVNVSKKFRDLFSDLNLDRVLHIYSTDVEFDLSKDEIWEKKLTEESEGFIFVAQVEKNLFRLTFSGQMTSLHDLSLLSEFVPEENIDFIVMNLDSLDLIDTYGAQLFNDFIERIQNLGKKCVIYGANELIRNLFNLFPTIIEFTFFESEKEALESIM